MKFPFLTSVLLFCGVLAYTIKRSNARREDEEEEFWERERQANATRRKSLDGLDYISVPIESLPVSLHTDDETIMEYINTLTDLSSVPIVNLTGYSNTDLKLEYGAPNIDLLSLYDQRYTTLVSTLQRWADKLDEYGETEAVKTILEFAVSTRSDVSKSYKRLASIYNAEGNIEAIQKLLPIAQSLKSPMKDSIIKAINSQLN